MKEDERWLTALGAESSVKELQRGLALADGFDLYLVLVQTPRMARAWCRLLSEGRALRRLDPYEGWDLRCMISEERLAERVLLPLLSAGRGEGWLLDCSRLQPQEKRAWTFLFGRMNERRNDLRERIGAPLVLCLPEALERRFAAEAPDLWSVRSAVLRAETLHRLELVWLLGEAWPLGERVSLASQRTIAAWERLRPIVAALEKPSALGDKGISPWIPEWIYPYLLQSAASGDAEHAAWLCAQMVRASQVAGQEVSPWYRYTPLQWQGGLAWERGDRALTLAASVQAVAACRERMREGDWWVDPLLPLLLRIGDVHLEWGHLKEARGVYRRALRLINQGRGERPNAWSRERLLVLVRLQAMAKTLPELHRAYRHILEEGADDEGIRSAALREDERRDRSVGSYRYHDWGELALAVLRAAGDFDFARGDWQRALVHYEAMANLARREDPEQVPRLPWGRYLIIARYLSAAICRQALALTWLERSTDALERLSDMAAFWKVLRSRHPFPVRHAAAEAQVYLTHAEIHDRTGRPQAALLRYRAALVRLEAQYPGEADNQLWRGQTRVCQRAVARLQGAAQGQAR